MLIDSENPSTYPLEMQDDVYQYIAKCLSSIEKQIKKIPLNYDSDVRCAIEDYLRPFKADELYQKLLRIMSDTELICYHASKVYDCNQILERGLHTNDWDRYSAFMRETLVALGSTNIDDTIKRIHKEYNRKYAFADRQPQLYFFSGLQLADGGDSAGYDQFCENIGGELARWALKDTMPEVFQLLKNNGVQVIIKFKLPFADIVDYQKEIIIYQFISYYAAKYFWNWDYSVEFDGATNRDVAPEQILDIIEYEKEVLMQ